MDGSLRRRLDEALGAGAVLEDGAVLCPADAEGVASALRIADTAGHRLRISSGHAAPRADAGSVLCLRRLTGLAVEPATGVARVEAGVTVADLRTALAGAGVGVPGLPGSGRSEHAGALVARGELPRRSLCGLEAVLPGGDLVRAGGGVLKDVVGYDLGAVLLGSGGRLAAITAVYLRLAPPAAHPPLAAPPGHQAVGDLAEAFDPAGILVEP